MVMLFGPRGLVTSKKLGRSFHNLHSTIEFWKMSTKQHSLFYHDVNVHHGSSHSLHSRFVDENSPFPLTLSFLLVYRKQTLPQEKAFLRYERSFSMHHAAKRTDFRASVLACAVVDRASEL